MLYIYISYRRNPFWVCYVVYCSLGCSGISTQYIHRPTTERQPRDKRKNEDNETMIDKLTYINSQDLFADASAIIETAKNIACRSINITLVQRNWLLGKRIAEEQLGDQTREELYGQKIVENLAKELTEQYGSGFDFSSLYKYIRFYQCFPNIVDAARQQSFLLT